MGVSNKRLGIPNGEMCTNCRWRERLFGCKSFCTLFDCLLRNGEPDANRLENKKCLECLKKKTRNVITVRSYENRSLNSCTCVSSEILLHEMEGDGMFAAGQSTWYFVCQDCGTTQYKLSGVTKRGR
jgi:hypothetical protein